MTLMTEVRTGLSSPMLLVRFAAGGDTTFDVATQMIGLEVLLTLQRPCRYEVEPQPLLTAPRTFGDPEWYGPRPRTGRSNLVCVMPDQPLPTRIHHLRLNSPLEIGLTAAAAGAVGAATSATFLLGAERVVALIKSVSDLRAVFAANRRKRAEDDLETDRLKRTRQNEDAAATARRYAETQAWLELPLDNLANSLPEGAGDHRDVNDLKHAVNSLLTVEHAEVTEATA